MADEILKKLDYVYDLLVESNENFFVNNILCHNIATPRQTVFDEEYKHLMQVVDQDEIEHNLASHPDYYDPAIECLGG